MKTISFLITLIFIALTIAGCGTASYKDTPDFRGQLETRNNRADIKTKLMAQYQEWRGIPYRHGGLSKRGIDCSGFVYVTYRKQFGITLPRSTEQQSLVGIEINPRDMRTGDLVFFNSLFSDMHVGIYLGKRQFLHASTSKGVMISTLDNDYWRDKLWKVLRI